MNSKQTVKVEPRRNARARQGIVVPPPGGRDSADTQAMRPSQAGSARPIAESPARSVSANAHSHGRRRHHKRHLSQRLMRGLIAVLTILAIGVVVLLIQKF